MVLNPAAARRLALTWAKRRNSSTGPTGGANLGANIGGSSGANIGGSSGASGGASGGNGDDGATDVEESRSPSPVTPDSEQVVEVGAIAKVADAGPDVLIHQSHSGPVPGDQRKYPRTGKRGAPQAFAHKLYEILEAESTEVIAWSGTGRAFFIKDMDIFVSQVLLKYFRHVKYSSFQRQLNLYGFRKATKGQDVGGYYHHYFMRSRRDLLPFVRRTPQQPQTQREFVHHAPAPALACPEQDKAPAVPRGRRRGAPLLPAPYRWGPPYVISMDEAPMPLPSATYGTTAALVLPPHVSGSPVMAFAPPLDVELPRLAAYAYGAPWPFPPPPPVPIEAYYPHPMPSPPAAPPSPSPVDDSPPVPMVSAALLSAVGVLTRKSTPPPTSSEPEDK